EREFGKSVSPSEDEVLERDLELSVVGVNFPIGILRRCGFEEFRWRRITRQPQLHRVVINSVSAAEDFRAGIGRISPGSDILELEHAATFIVAMQNVFGIRGAHHLFPVWSRARLRA